MLALLASESYLQRLFQQRSLSFTKARHEKRATSMRSKNKGITSRKNMLDDRVFALLG